MDKQGQSLKPLHNDTEIDNDWLEKMLSEHFQCLVTVKSWKKTNPSNRQGFLSEICFVQVNYLLQDGKEQCDNFVLKFLPEEDELKSFIVEGGLGEREVDFYAFANSPELIRICQSIDINFPVPKSLFSKVNDKALTLVFEDLNFKNYKTVIVKEGTNLPQTITVLESLAIIHAVGYIYIKKYGEMKLGKPFNNDFLGKFLIPNLITLEHMYADSCTADTMKALRPLVKKMRKISSSYPFLNTLIHGDFWVGQFMFSGDENVGRVLDWQFGHIGNPVCDVLSMFFMSCNPEVLENNLTEVLQAYWKKFTMTLEAGGCKIQFTYDDLVENIENMWVYGFMLLAASIHDFLGAGNITEHRLRAAVGFLEKRGTFNKFFENFA